MLFFLQFSFNQRRLLFVFIYFFLLLSDHIFEEILYSTDDGLKDARMKLEDVVRRRLPKCVGETRITETEHKDNWILEVKEDILQFMYLSWTCYKSMALM